ncbi:MAG: NGG1p interacting factor NIF3 [Candidatus Omnitrophica bacterium]|nr:NGG1p interacting factor NIF3 [Candidatus Omnitrophota bacterium]
MRDPRGAKGIKRYLGKIKKEYSSLSPKDKKLFDKEKLTNPYSDTRLLHGNPNKQIKNVMVGIDVDTQELLLALALSKKGKKIDLLISHHPQGFARGMFHEVMNVQADIFKSLGVPAKKAEKLLDERMIEVARKGHAANNMRPLDAARLLDMPYMCAHTVADNCVVDYLKKLIKRKRPRTVQNLIDIISSEPEYKDAILTHAGPKLILGKPSNKCGKVFVDMTGGTEGPKKIFADLAKAGVKTIIGMHMSEEHFKIAKKYKLNILIAGHISSDNLGINLLLDAIDKKRSLNIIECSGFRRVKRKA